MEEQWRSAQAALEAGDPLRALNYVALGDEPTSLALRGIAMAQLGDLARAKGLLARAARGFGTKDALARARTVTALAEIALATRELQVPLSTLRTTLLVFDAAGDARNALHARVLLCRSLILAGKLPSAEAALADVRLREAPPSLVAMTELVRAEIALRHLEAAKAEIALERARRAAERSGIASLQHEVLRMKTGLDAPAARVVEGGEPREVRLADVERLLSEDVWLVDACRRQLRRRERALDFSRKPVRFELLRALAETWPSDVPRDALIARAFGAKNPNESHRARLRVELGRVRSQLSTLGGVEATTDGYRLALASAARVVVLAPALEGEESALLALLSDGASWSSSALATALGTSQRTLQRLLTAAAERGAVRTSGKGRGQRWFAAPMGQLGPQVHGLFPHGLGAET